MSLSTELNQDLIRFYNEKFYFSYSGINKLLQSPRWFYNHYILNQKEDSTDAHLIAGRVLHCLLLEPDKFNDQFVMLPGKIPTDSNRVILDHIFYHNYLPLQNESLTLEDFPTDILNQLLVNNLYQALKTDAQRVEKILTDNNKVYFNFLKVKQQGKTVIDASVKSKAEESVECLRADGRVMGLLMLGHDGSNGVTVYNEVPLKTELTDFKFGLKGFADNIVVDENTKTIFINDLKTTNKSIQNFPDTVEYYRYDIQAAIYCIMGFNNLIKEKADANEWKIMFTFIVIDKYNQVYPFQVSEETLSIWMENFSALLNVLNYHYEYKDFTLPYDLAIGNVKL
jgi:hypothetical protein